MVGWSLEHGYVERVVGIVFVDGGQQFLLGKPVIFIRHAKIPQYIFVAGFWHECAAGQLHVVVIRPYRYYLEFPGVGVVVHLEIVGAVLFVAESGKFAPFLE